MAAPLVAGIASSFWARNPDLSASEVKARILSSVDVPEEPFDGDTVTGGRINMKKLNQDKIGFSSKISSHEFTSTTDSYSHVERWQKEMDITNWITPTNLNFHDSDDLKGKTVIGLLSDEIRDKEKVVNDLAKDIKTDQEELKHIDFLNQWKRLIIQYVQFNCQIKTRLSPKMLLEHCSTNSAIPDSTLTVRS